MIKKILALLFSSQIAAAEDGSVSENYVDFDVVWGGYYAAIPKEEDEISIFRLLDFNRDAYHIAMFAEKFNSVPKESEIMNLSPFVGHAPIASKGLLNYKEIVLISSSTLTEDDLVGYMYYLEQFGVSKEDREKLSKDLVAFAKEPPLKLRLSIENDQLKLNER